MVTKKRIKPNKAVMAELQKEINECQYRTTTGCDYGDCYCEGDCPVAEKAIELGAKHCDSCSFVVFTDKMTCPYCRAKY